MPISVDGVVKSGGRYHVRPIDGDGGWLFVQLLDGRADGMKNFKVTADQLRALASAADAITGNFELVSPGISPGVFEPVTASNCVRK